MQKTPFFNTFWPLNHFSTVQTLKNTPPNNFFEDFFENFISLIIKYLQIHYTLYILDEVNLHFLKKIFKSALQLPLSTLKLPMSKSNDSQPNWKLIATSEHWYIGRVALPKQVQSIKTASPGRAKCGNFGIAHFTPLV